MSYSKSKNSDESSLESFFNMMCAYKIDICNLNLEIDIDLYLLCLNLTAILIISWQMSATEIHEWILTRNGNLLKDFQYQIQYSAVIYVWYNVENAIRMMWL